jgi:hypothetical protein
MQIPMLWKNFSIWETHEYFLSSTQNIVLNLFLQIMSLYIEHGQKTHGGNGMEIYWRDNVICPTEEEYLELAVASEFENQAISFHIFLIWESLSFLNQF